MRNRKILSAAIFLIVLGFYIIFQQVQSQQTNIAEIKDSSAVLSASSTASNSATIPDNLTAAKVDRVVDGDTIEITYLDASGKSVQSKLRYIGMDTPETVDPKRPVGCFGHQASDENKKLVEGKQVFLEKDISETDKFGRLLRYVYTKDESGNLFMVNDYLVKNGFARILTYPPDVKYSEQFLNSQHQAQDQKLGLWSSC